MSALRSYSMWKAPIGSKRATAAPSFEQRWWADMLFVALKAMGKTPRWLGAAVGYRNPASMHQVVNGHQGISREVYERILVHVPALLFVAEPPLKLERKGRGARGVHKKHEYPEGTTRRRSRW